jgi:predicted DNA-binding transcriptional regulator AlpA
VPHTVSPPCPTRRCARRSHGSDPASLLCAVRTVAFPFVGSDRPVEWPGTLVSVRLVESAAATHAQRHAAIHASGRLFAAARTAGWTSRQLADATGLTLFVVKARTRSATARGDVTTGLDIPREPSTVRPPPSPWLSTKQVREATGIGKSTLYQWRLHGLLPRARFVEGRWRYHRDDVDRLLALRGAAKTLPKNTIKLAVPALHLRVAPPAGFERQLGDRNKTPRPAPRASS